MTEAEWLASDDPARMLTEPMFGYGTKVTQRVSDRKLRLFACACCLLRGSSPEAVDGYEKNGAPTDEVDVERTSDQRWAAEWARKSDAKVPTQAQKAALLREIVGNPFQSATLPPRPVVECDRCSGKGHTLRCPDCGGEWGGDVGPDCFVCSAPQLRKKDCAACNGAGKVPGPCPWLTPQVVALATAAYEDNGGRVCKKCGGYQGRRSQYTQHDPTANCSTCHGTGRTGAGTLDPFRLALLADALEEAGCDSAELLMHLRGYEVCPMDGHESHGDGSVNGGRHFTCYRCQKVPGWRTLPGPHVRGCWALDLVLGKE